MTAPSTPSSRIVLRIARQEFTGIAREGRSRLVVVGTLLLLVLALAIGWRERDIRSAERETAARVQREYWLNLPRMNPHAAAHIGMFVFKPQDPLSFVEPGLTPFTGDALFLEAHRSNPAQFRPAADAAPARRLGQLSAGLILLLVAPLAISLLTFDSLAGERERGTLRQLLATGLRPSQLLLGKLVGIVGVTGLFLVPLAAMTTWSVAAAAGGQRDLFFRSALLVSAYGIYLAVYLMIGVAVSLWANTRRTALLTLLVIWFATCLGLPRLAAATGQLLYPVPPALEFARGVELDLARLPEFWERHPLVVERLLREYRVASIAGVPVSAEGVTLQEGEEEETAVYARHLRALYERYERQADTFQAFGLLSPAIALHEVATALAGSGLGHHLDFLDAAERYRRDYVRQLNEELIKHDRTWNQRRAGRQVAAYTQEKKFWEKIPAFDYRPPALTEIVRREWRVFLLLAGWLLVAVVALGLAARSRRGRTAHV